MNNEIFDKVTVIIPTFNRYQYLLRLLNYYKSYNFPFRILILDSSTNSFVHDRIRSLISNSQVCYRRFNAKFNIAAKMVDGLRHVSTPYSVICADDDFIIPNGIRESIAFLEDNADFSVAHGIYIGFWLRKVKGNKQKFYCQLSNNCSSVVFSDSKERLIYHMSNYSPTFYGVHRTYVMKIIWEETAKSTDTDVFLELLPSMLTLIYGKIKFLEVFYAARQRELIDSSGAKSKKLTDFIKEGTLDGEYAKLRECLGKHLYNKTQLDIKESEKVVDEGMSIYLSGCLRNQEPMTNILIRKIKNVLESSKLPAGVYEEIRELYRKLFLRHQTRMDDFKNFENTPFSNFYDEIKNIHNHLLTSENK